MAIGEMEAKLIKYLTYMKKVDGSDLHIKATAIARGRVKGKEKYHQRLISIRLGEVDGGKNAISEDIG